MEILNYNQFLLDVLHCDSTHWRHQYQKVDLCRSAVEHGAWSRLTPCVVQVVQLVQAVHAVLSQITPTDNTGSLHSTLYDNKSSIDPGLTTAVIMQPPIRGVSQRLIDRDR